MGRVTITGKPGNDVPDDSRKAYDGQEYQL
jgi:hypothetical protein